ALFAAANGLKCIQDGHMSNVVYDHGIIVSSFSQDFSYGFAKCASNLDRCVSFTTMSIPDFLKLDAGTDNSNFANSIRHQAEGTVSGRCCMSQSDVQKIGVS
ncbi:hypothetical protein PMAYCL1PPCAC_32144, partial [Pristionchus mayeri]